MTVSSEIIKGIKKLKSFYTEPNYEKKLNEIFQQNYYDNYIKENSLDIAFLVPEVMSNSGGHRNIFRAVKKLDEFGHKLTVYIVGSKYLNEQKYIINKNFNDFRNVDIKLFTEETIISHDVCIATWWETFYLMYENKHKFKQMFYLVLHLGLGQLSIYLKIMVRKLMNFYFH